MDDIIFYYDGSFEGFLSVVFEIYKRKISSPRISHENVESDLFSASLMMTTDYEKADRVLNGIISKSNKRTTRFLYECFLSELYGIEIKLLHLIRLILSGNGYKIKDFSDPIIVDLHRIKKIIGREVHRMHAFVRFQQTKDNMWACEINPDFNVLPLIGKHFKDRYPALEWIIIDVNRHYALYHKEGKMDYATFEGKKKINRIDDTVITKEERDYQSMWKQYFKSVNIEERNNEKLHIRHVPKRYWKFLIEKR